MINMADDDAVYHFTKSAFDKLMNRKCKNNINIVIRMKYLF